MKMRLVLSLMVVLSAAGCVHAAAYHPQPPSVWLSFGPLQENPDPLSQSKMLLRGDGTYATVTRSGGGDVVITSSAEGVIPDSAMARMRALADLPEVREYRGCGAVDGPDRLYVFQIKRWSFTQRIVFTYPCRPTFPGGVEKLFLAFQRGLAGAPPF
ncbi:MAG: hypothetical protein ACYCVL_12440 [Gemmatimonadaceae bacterium]